MQAVVKDFPQSVVHVSQIFFKHAFLLSVRYCFKRFLDVLKLILSDEGLSGISLSSDWYKISAQVLSERGRRALRCG